MTQHWESGMNACGLALSQITYLIASLTKKNNKSSIVELKQLVERHGEEARKHVLHTLFSQVEFSSDGKSTGKDFHQTQILIQEAGELITKPNFIGLLCHATYGTLRPSPSLFPSLVKVLRLSPLNEIVFALALSQSPDQDIQKQAISILDSKLCAVLRQYLKDGDASVKELPVHMVYYAISYLVKENGIQHNERDVVLDKLRAVFHVEDCPIILEPLLHKNTVFRHSLHTTTISTNLETEPHNLAALIKECGYSSCENLEELQSLFNVVNSDITARTVAKTLGMMIQPAANADDMISLQNINSAMSWNDKTEPRPATSWNIENFIHVLKQKVPHLDWREVIIELDYPEFFVYDVQGLNFILKAYHLGTTNPFPTTAIYRMWANVKGQLSWIKQSLANDSDFKFTKIMTKLVDLDILKSPPEEGMPEVHIREVWTSLDLIETLLNLGECGERAEVISILSTPAKLCPDILMLGLLQSKCSWHTLQDDMIRSLLQTFLGNHPNSAIILHYCWSGPQNRQTTLQNIVLNAMCDYYIVDQAPNGQVDQTRLSRILDVAQDLKTLSQLLKSPNFLFVIELAVLASRREYLKLEKWLTDKLVTHQETFVRATITYLKRKLENEGPKNPPLPQETILSILHCLQRVLQQSTLSDGFPLTPEVKDHIHHLLGNHLPPTSISSMLNNNMLPSSSNNMLPTNNNMLPTNNNMLPTNNNNMLQSSNNMLQSSNNMLQSSNNMLQSSNNMLPNNNNMQLPSNNIMSGNNLGSLGGISSLQSKLPQLMGQNNQQNTPVSLGMSNGLGSVLGGGITPLQSNNNKHLLQHYGQSSSSPPIPDNSSFSAVVAQQQRRTSLSQPSSSLLGSGLTQGSLNQQSSMSNIGQQNPQQSLLSQNNLQNLTHMNLGGASSPISGQPNNPGPNSQNIFGHSGINKLGINQSGFGQNMGTNSLGNIGQTNLASHLSSLSQNNIGQNSFNSLSQQGLGGGGVSNQNFMGNFEQQSAGSQNQSGRDNSYPKDIEDEANAYFQKIIINKSIPISQALDMLYQFKNSSDKRENNVFQCMLQALFEEYRFYNQYPEKELIITGKLFGGIIERGLVEFVSLGYALRYILESLIDPTNRKMHMFGIHALEEFKHKLKDYPQYCRYLKEKIPNIRDFPPRLLEFIEHGAEMQKPPQKHTFSANPTARIQQQGFGNSQIGPMQQNNLQQSSFQSMFGNQTNNNQYLNMFGQNNTSGGSTTGNLFNSPQPASSPTNSPQITSFNLQNLLNNSTKNNIGSSLGNIGSSLGGLPPASSPNILSQITGNQIPGNQMPGNQLAGNQMSGNQLPGSQIPSSQIPGSQTVSQGRSTPVRTSTPQSWQQSADNAQEEKKSTQEVKVVHQSPPEGVQDKILFIFNNISQDNIVQKAEEWLEIVEQQFYPWAAQYLIMERVSIEPNFHKLYLQFVMTLNNKEYSAHILTEAYLSIKALLKSPTMSANSTNEKSFLKNLGSFLGLYTLGRNKPILQLDLDIKSLILEALYKGEMTGSKQDYLFFVLPFVCSVMRSVLNSKVFSAPNAWTMGILGILVEIQNIPDLKITLKFEIELLMKDLNTNMSSIKVKNVLKMDSLLGLKDKFRVEQLVSLTSTTNTAPMITPQSFTPTPLRSSTSPQQHTMQMMQQQPFNDLNSMSDYSKIRIHPGLALFQKRPELQRCVQNAIESALSQLSRLVVTKSINMTLTTAENIIKKDFALDPEESRMRLAAQHMVRHISAAAVLIFARDQLKSTMHDSLMKNFMPNIPKMQGLGQASLDSQMLSEAIEAANRIATDNVDLACIKLQADAVRQAYKEIDKRLEKEYRKRFECRKEGQRFTNPVVATLQDQLPEQLRLQAGGCSPQQFQVYQQYGKNIPPSLPLPVALPTIPSISSQLPLHAMDKWNNFEQPAELENLQQGFDMNRPNTMLNNRMTSFLQHNSGLGDRSGLPDDISRMMMYKQQQQQQHLPTQQSGTHNDDLNRLLDNLHSQLEGMLLEYPVNSFLRTTLDKLLKTISSAKFNSADSIRLIVYSVEGILECHRPEVIEREPERAKQLCEFQLVMLKFLGKSNVFGPQVLQKHATKAVAEAKEDIKYNEHAIDLLIKHNLIMMKEFCSHLALTLNEKLNIVPYAVLVKNTLFTLHAQLCVSLCKKASQPDSSVREEDVKPLMEILKLLVQNKQPDQGREEDPKLREDCKLLAIQWMKIHARNGETTEQQQQQMASTIINNLQHNVSRTEEFLTHLFKVFIEMLADNFYNCQKLITLNNVSPYTIREETYHHVDSYVKLVLYMMRYQSGEFRLKLLSKVLFTVKMVLQKDHDTKKTHFLALPYHRFFAILFSDVVVTFDKMTPQILQIFCNVYHALQPNNVPGFTYSWLELISHRVFVNKLLTTDNKAMPTQGWGLYQQLLIDLFKFLYPFLRNAELIIKNETLYKGTLRCLLVLLHDFPEFLCDYHFPFCDVIPPGCLQLRNIILSAFPRSMVPPDPFSKDLKVDQLETIAESPRMSYDYTSAIPPTFKKDLDSYLKSRTPVTFLTELQKHLKTPTEEMSRVVGQGEPLSRLETGSKYNIPLMNALVLYVGVQAIKLIHSTNRHTPTQTTIAQGAHMDIFQHLAVDLDNEGRYLFLNAICNQLRYPNNHTHYFSCTLLYLFAEGHSEKLREQITRILLERLCVNRPHPWGLVITFIELIKNRDYHFWDHDFVTCAPEIENMFKSVFSNLQSKTNASLNNREETE